MPPYPLYCYTRDCRKLARFKIAARWSDGFTHELKTYALSCEDCLASWFQRCLQKHAACRRAPGETLEVPGIYDLVRGQRDLERQRRLDLETNLTAS